MVFYSPNDFRVKQMLNASSSVFSWMFFQLLFWHGDSFSSDRLIHLS